MAKCRTNPPYFLSADAGRNCVHGVLVVDALAFLLRFLHEGPEQTLDAIVGALEV